jgi:hypothetical protein
MRLQKERKKNIMNKFPAVKEVTVCFANAFASTALSGSFDDIRKGNFHNENIIFMIKKGFADKC